MTVYQYQLLLAYLGYSVAPDGICGPQTEAAVREFQKDFGGISVDGRAGPETQQALRHSVAYGLEKRTDTEAEAGPDSGTGDGWGEIEYFTREEFRCTCGGRYCSGYPVEPDMALVKTLDQIRRHFGTPFTPNSAIRCRQRNGEVGGAENSQHLTGKAADITIFGHGASEVAAYAETLLPDTGGIGIYSWGIHVDTRSEKARWRG